MSSWTNLEPNYSYSRKDKRRFDEINTTIGSLKTELIFNDVLLKGELNDRVYSDSERALLAAELYKERLEALANSSRYQIWRVQSGNFPAPADDFHLDYDSWSPKRMKYNYGEGFAQNSNTYYQDCAINTIRNRKKKKPNKPGPVKPAISKPIASISSNKPKTKPVPIKNNTCVKTSPPTKFNSLATGVTKANNHVPLRNAAMKPGPSNSTISVANIKTGNTINVKSNLKGQVGVTKTKKKICTTSTSTTASENLLSSIKSEPNDNESSATQNIPSLFSINVSHVKLEPTNADQIFANNKDQGVCMTNSNPGFKALRIKEEPIAGEDVMVDDLADHL